MKICVAGVGAIGGLLAAMLAKRYGTDVSLIAHGARAESLCANGITLHSELLGEITTRVGRVEEDGAKLAPQDVVFVCVKNYSLTQICRQIRPCVTENTILIPVMNGIEPGDTLRKQFPEALVGDALIYTTTGANADFSVTQNGPYTTLYIGSTLCDARHKAAAHTACELLTEAGLDCRYAENIESEIWRKYILNCAFNILTGRYLATASELRAQPERVADFEALLREATLVATKSGIDLPPDLVQQHMRFFREQQSPKATSSLCRDLKNKRRTELDAFLGALLRKADALGVAVPVSRRYYKELSEMERAYYSPPLVRGSFRAVLRPDAAPDAVACRAALQAAVDGGVLTASLYRYGQNLFLYAESAETLPDPSQLLAPLTPLLQPWPGVLTAPETPRTWVAMQPVFYHAQPTTVAAWQRPVPPARRRGRLAVLPPAQWSDYLYHHLALVREGAIQGDRYHLISLHENLLFSYFEEPKTLVNLQNKPEAQSPALQDWLATDPQAHFARFAPGQGPGPDENFVFLECVASV